MQGESADERAREQEISTRAAEKVKGDVSNIKQTHSKERWGNNEEREEEDELSYPIKWTVWPEK